MPRGARGRGMGKTSEGGGSPALYHDIPRNDRRAPIFTTAREYSVYAFSANSCYICHRHVVLKVPSGISCCLPLMHGHAEVRLAGNKSDWRSRILGRWVTSLFPFLSISVGLPELYLSLGLGQHGSR